MISSHLAAQRLDELAGGQDGGLWNAIVDALDYIEQQPEHARTRSQSWEGHAGTRIYATPVVYDLDPRWVAYWDVHAGEPRVLGLGPVPA